jgi:hypothetical protein
MDKPTYLIQTFYDQYCKVSERNEVMEDFVPLITQKTGQNLPYYITFNQISIITFNQVTGNQFKRNIFVV